MIVDEGRLWDIEGVKGLLGVFDFIAESEKRPAREKETRTSRRRQDLGREVSGCARNRAGDVVN